MFLWAFLAAAGFGVQQAMAMEFYVSPYGADTNPGTQNHPFATVQRAQQAVREVKQKGPLIEPIRVILAEGIYRIEEPIVFQPEDSGTAQAPIVYQAASGARAVVCGGRPLRGWQQTSEGLWKTKVPEVAQGKWYFEQLFVNGRRAVRAREPDQFYFYMEDVVQRPLEIVGPGKEAQLLIRLRPEDAEATLAKIRPEEIPDVVMVAYHKWDITRRRLEGVNPEEGTFISTGRKMKPWNPLQKGTRMHLENFRAALDKPGEWFLDRQGNLWYWPLPGEALDQTELIAPVAEKFLIFQGQPRQNRWVEHITIQGLTFLYGQYITPPEGFEPSQAAASIEAVIQADGARDIRLQECQIGHIGTYAVWFRESCKHCEVRQCYLYDLGAGGIRIGQMTIPKEQRLETDHCIVDNCIIRHGGRIFPCAVGIWIGHSSDNQITHNEIADFFYTGISVGWRWGYGPSLAKRNLIAFNHVHHLGWGLLCDMGGIYTLGPSEGTIVRNNVFHDIDCYRYGGWGLYTDEGSSGILFEKNLVYRTETGAFHQHYGKENVVRNNIFAFQRQSQLQASRVEKHLSFVFEKNIVYWDRGVLLAGPWDRLRFESRQNCYWQAAGEPVRFLGRTLQQWQKLGHETDSIIADPKFRLPKQDDFTLAEDSPVWQLGFERFDPGQAGVYGSAEWLQKAHEVVFADLPLPPPPRPSRPAQ
ncbi:MAG: right-handed parallel beta-helix repeat-containing protein [Thermoguttaceae bacterium]|nr:right-handed parallel beta-helix repeat-containing protein [Thermoguttaceae bacterium]